MEIDPNNICMHKGVYLYAYGKIERGGIRDIHINKNGKMTGFNIRGSDFDMFGYCKITPWIKIIKIK